MVVASNGGPRNHPSWFHNLMSNPRINVEVATDTFTVLAEKLDDAARAELWPKLVAEAPQLGQYETWLSRHIPVLVLTPPGLIATRPAVERGGSDRSHTRTADARRRGEGLRANIRMCRSTRECEVDG